MPGGTRQGSRSPQRLLLPVFNIKPQTLTPKLLSNPFKAQSLLHKNGVARGAGVQVKSRRVGQDKHITLRLVWVKHRVTSACMAVELQGSQKGSNYLDGAALLAQVPCMQHAWHINRERKLASRQPKLGLHT
jgi:hypothetical protein